MANTWQGMNAGLSGSKVCLAFDSLSIGDEVMMVNYNLRGVHMINEKNYQQGVKDWEAELPIILQSINR